MKIESKHFFFFTFLNQTSVSGSFGILEKIEMNYKMTRGRDIVETVLAIKIELAPNSVLLTCFSGFG